MAIKVNQITEFVKGVYGTVLDFPTKDFLKILINKSFKYVWCICYEEDKYEWKTCVKNLYGFPLNDVLVRNVKFEYIIETSKFIDLLPHIQGGIHIIQINKIPPYYLNGAMSTMNRKTKYDLLRKETDFLFEINLPSSPDYTSLVSPNREFVENVLLMLKEINQAV